MPHLADLHKSLANNPRFVLLSVSVDDHIEQPARFMKAHDYPFTHAYGGSYLVSPSNFEYSILGVPSFWIIGPDGKILAKSGDWGKFQVLSADGSRESQMFSDQLLDDTVKKLLSSNP